MASLNEKHDPGDFDQLVQVRKITGFTDEVNQQPIHGMAQTFWAMVAKPNYNSSANENKKGTNVENADVIQETIAFVLRRQDRCIEPNTHEVKYCGQWLKIIMVEHIGRIYTTIKAEKFNKS